MFGPGEYCPDPTEGVTRKEDLPQPRMRRLRRSFRYRPCPACGCRAPRRRKVTRLLHELGDPRTGYPCRLEVTYSQHRCKACGKWFNADMTDLAPPGSHYTHNVVRAAVHVVVEDGLPYREASWHLWRAQRVFVPFATIQNWVEAAGKKRSGALAHGISALGAPELLRLHRG